MGVLDAAFWYLEDDHASLHIASVTVFDGPAPDYTEVLDAVERRLPELPRYRKKMRRVPLGLARPVWIDDPHFDLKFHVRRTALPSPGGDVELQTLAERLMSQSMDVDRPLWEAWFVEGLSDGRWAVVWKVHHSMVDGVGGMALLATMLDAAPDSILPPRRSWTARPEPGSLRLMGAALVDRSRSGYALVGTVADAARRPATALRTVGTVSRGLARYARAARPVDKSSLVGTLTSSRGFTWTSSDIADVATVRRVFGGSLNDVVLTMVTRGLRDLLASHDEWPGPHAVRCLVPVSVRGAGESQAGANRISALLADLPVQLDDPVEAYLAVVTHTADLKSSYEAVAGEKIVAFAGYLPSRAVRTALRAAFHVPQRFVSTVATNVPGPRWPLYFLGRRMIGIYPYVPIADRLRVAVAVTSYDGRLYFGVTSDRNSVTDADVLRDGLAAGLSELVAAASILSDFGTEDSRLGTTFHAELGKQA
jgi:diacylglycerol O-acyltransferase / wax synthase